MARSGVRGRILLSASRRTDLPGWHADRLAGRLREVLARRGAEGIYGVVFWTRFPAALTTSPLRELLEGALRNVCVNLTLTGLGGSRLEPRGPDAERVLAELPGLIALIGGPSRLRWRFDPLIPTDDLLDRFGDLAPRFAALGVDTCTFAFPSARSLRGNLLTRYRDLGVPRWPDEVARRDFVARMADVAGPLGIQLLSCSQPEVLGYHRAVRPAQCIPGNILAAAYPPGTPGPSGKDPSQRRHCTCPPSQDLGDYRIDACSTGCLYCYSTLGGPDAGETVPWFLRGR
jgi:Domain of unknown function (DUF1848)